MLGREKICMGITCREEEMGEEEKVAGKKKKKKKKGARVENEGL